MKLPDTCNGTFGVSVPIPIFPVGVIVRYLDPQAIPT